MPTPPLLDFEALTAPIPGDDPSGVSFPFGLRETLDGARKEINPDDYDPDDPTRPTEAKWADWPGIVEAASEALAETSKDLNITARLTEALTKVHGFAGLRDSLTLLHTLVDEAWDRLRPPIEEPDDLEVRASAFNWLDDPDRGARFPITVRQVPMLPGPISWMDWQGMQSGRSQVKPDQFEKAVASVSRDHCQTIVDDLTAAAERLESLVDTLVSRMADVAPGMTTLRQAMRDCLQLARQLLDKKGPPPSAVVENAGDGEAGGDGGGGGGGGGQGGGVDGAFLTRAVQSRAQIYSRLTEVADMLQQLEPHSPIPYLIRRAVELGDLPFPELMKRLVRDSSVLSDLGRNLGIPELNE